MENTNYDIARSHDLLKDKPVVIADKVAAQAVIELQENDMGMDFITFEIENLLMKEGYYV